MNNIRKKRSPRDRLAGALGGAGGALVLIPLLDYLLFQGIWSPEIFVVSEALGIFLIILGTTIYTRK